MGPYDPGHMTGVFAHQDTWWEGALHILPLVLFLALIGVLIWAVLRMSGSRAAMGMVGPASLPGSSASRDSALDELRIRYARGEVDRQEYLARSADLGAPGAGAEPPAAT